MIKKLRIKFIVAAMGSLCVIFLMLIGTIYIGMSWNNKRQAYILMEKIAENDGMLAPRSIAGPNVGTQGFPGARIYNRSFSVKLDQNNQIIEYVNAERINLTTNEINQMVGKITKSNKTTGSVSEYHYLTANKDYGKIVVFLDYSIENSLLDRLIYTCLAVGFLGVIIFFGIIYLLSHWATKPIQIAFDKQKEFISNASHELKTPLTIISTNASVLERTIGDNKWLQYIQTNIRRMNQLVTDLLSLTRMENSTQVLIFHEFDLGKAILQSALPFESTAYETSKNFTLQVPEEIMYQGNEESIKQLIAILLDNAFKYSNPNGTIQVSLTVNNGRKIIKIYNTGLGILKTEKYKIFERFYRSDSSRARESGGYGLGLAIAKSIVDAHKGHISVDGKEGEWVAFSVIL